MERKTHLESGYHISALVWLLDNVLRSTLKCKLGVWKVPSVYHIQPNSLLQFIGIDKTWTCDLDSLDSQDMKWEE